MNMGMLLYLKNSIEKYEYERNGVSNLFMLFVQRF